jgi:uncharacterized SAM-binding protein YcdF (DUF218 family)
MLDSALCQEVSPTGLWTKLSWTLMYMLSQPVMVLGVLLLIAVLPRLLRQPRWKKPALKLSLSLLVIYLLVLSPLVTWAGNRLLLSFVPADSGETAEAIVVLGRGKQQNRNRSREAKTLWQAQRAPLIFASGRKDAPQIARIVKQLVPAKAIAGEPCSLTTNQNAEFTAALLRPQGIHKIILVTDPAHMLRSLLTFESFGFEVIPHISPLDIHTDSFKKRFLIFRESVGLLTYGLLGRYSAREVPPVSVIYADQPNADQPNAAISIRP